MFGFKKGITTRLFVYGIAICFNIGLHAQQPLLSVGSGLFDASRAFDLGLIKPTGIETVTVYCPTDKTDRFSNGVVMIGFKNHLYCMWQSSAVSEDTPDTWVAYSRSEDGLVWTEPMVLAPTIPDGYCSSGGWWTSGDTLIGYINTWPASLPARGGYTRFVASTDGMNWTEPKAVRMANGDTLKGIFEQDPHALPDGRIVCAAHFQPGLIVAPIYTDDPVGIRDWKKAEFSNLSISSNVSREIEPSWYYRSDGSLVMTFRDQNSTYRRLASVSYNRGQSWSKAVVTNMPDSRSKQSAGNLPDGTAFMVGNPVPNKTRYPLAIALSRDGFLFDTAYLLRAGGGDLQPQKYPGNAKSLGYSYPKSMVWKDHLYISYSTNKENVEYTRVPLSSLILQSSLADRINTSNKEDGKLRIAYHQHGFMSIYLRGDNSDGMVTVFNANGQVVAQKTMKHGTACFDLKVLPNGICIVEVRTNNARQTATINNKSR